MKQPIWLILISLVLSGCAGGLLPRQQAPLFYTLAYEYRPVGLKDTPTASVTPLIRIMPLQYSYPYGDRRMAVETPPVGVSLSELHQWIASPPLLVRDFLLKDLSSDGKVQIVEAVPGNPEFLYGLSGRVEKFSWVQVKKGLFRAELSVTLQLWSENFKRVLLSRRYLYNSEVHNANSPEIFASSMSELVGQLSRDFRRDLYEALFGKSTAGF